MDISQFNPGMQLNEQNHLSVSRTRKEPGVVCQMPRRFIFFDNLPGWKHTEIWNYTTPRMDASSFIMGQLKITKDGQTMAPVDNGYENFFFVITGVVIIRFLNESHRLEKDTYCYLPPDTAFEMSQEGEETAEILWIKKVYQPLTDAPVPAALVGNTGSLTERETTAEFIKECLPDGTDFGFDMSVNILTYYPGVTSARTEVHMSAHGAYVLGGRGEMVVNGRHYETHENDYFHIAPCASHYTVAYAPEPLRILLFEEVNRDYTL